MIFINQFPQRTHFEITVENSRAHKAIFKRNIFRVAGLFSHSPHSVAPRNFHIKPKGFSSLA
jgi:hypothetical protein